MLIRNYQREDADEIADLFFESVHGIDLHTLSDAQLEAWAPTPPDYQAWRMQLAAKKPYVAALEGRILGFIELEADGHIDRFYTRADYQRQGVGAALYAHLLAEAEARGIVDLYVEASEIARPFFEKKGFVLGKQNRIERGGEILTNYSMTLTRSGHCARGSA